jgi:hypothetical protein
MAGHSITVQRIALLGEPDRDGADASGVTLRGRVIDAELEPGALVEIRTDGDQIDTVPLSAGGEFVIQGVAVHSLISIRLIRNHRYYFSNLGRWFEATHSRADLAIRATPRFSNPDHHKPDAQGSKLLFAADQTLSGRFISHSRQHWLGYGSVPQEYDSITFSNNAGAIDTDRFSDNPDGCLRLVFAGSSMSVALQVPVGEKYNILLEEDLGIRLGRCVEAISVGRDNGDIASLYPRLKRVIELYHPDALFLENSSVAMSQFSPTLLLHNYGFDYEDSPLDHFTYDEDGKLRFVPWNRNYGVFATKATGEPLRKGVPLGVETMLSFDDMVPEVRNGYKLAADIVRLYKDEFAGIPIVLFSGFDQISCHGFCDGEIALPGGSKVRDGAVQFVHNNRWICREATVICIDPDFPKEFNDKPESYLSWINDSHLNPAGHQWLAAQLSAKIAKMYKNGTLRLARR